ncbi:MAG: hypothetical protein ACHQ1D_07225 [Nitrososphaerales archaeon]
MKDNKSLFPPLEGRLWITSVINKILSKSVYNNLYWLEGGRQAEKRKIRSKKWFVVCEIKAILQPNIVSFVIHYEGWVKE